MTPSPAHPIPAPFGALGVALIPEQPSGWRAVLAGILFTSRPRRSTARSAHN